jgi:hypothetical protein
VPYPSARCYDQTAWWDPGAQPPRRTATTARQRWPPCSRPGSRTPPSSTGDHLNDRGPGPRKAALQIARAASYCDGCGNKWGGRNAHRGDDRAGRVPAVRPSPAFPEPDRLRDGQHLGDRQRVFPTSTATSTATPTLSAHLPAAARENTPQGAGAFVTFFFKQVNRAWTRRQAGLLPPLCLSTSKSCASLEQTGVDLVANHQHYTGNPGTQTLGIASWVGYPPIPIPLPPGQRPYSALTGGSLGLTFGLADLRVAIGPGVRRASIARQPRSSVRR